MPSAAVSEEIEVIDSQDHVMEEGSKQQEVRQPDGSRRALTAEENATIAENEEIENFAADLMRLEEEKLQENFTSVELREWEDWAKGASQQSSRAKRARVQVLVQGEGGRIVKKENWLVAVNDGEYLAYSISVNRYETEQEDAGDPTATSSGDVRAADVVQEEEDQEAATEREAENDTDEGLLPVTGESAPTMWSQPNLSRVRDFSVDDFMQTPLAEKFYRAWRSREVTDSLIGRRFGYGVLGRFYSKKDWDNGVFQDCETAEGEGQMIDGQGGEEMAVEVGGEAGMDPSAGLTREPGSEGESAGHDQDAAPNDPTGHEDNEHVEGNEDGTVALGDGHGAGSSTGSTLPSSTAENAERVRLSSGRRQLTLAHWLL